VKWRDSHLSVRQGQIIITSLWQIALFKGDKENRGAD